MRDKNPFSIYDFLGYLFPGIVAIFVVFILRQSFTMQQYDFFACLHVHEIINLMQREMKLNWLEASMSIVVVAYIVGHLVAYASSLTVEFLAHKTLGYPSEYLLSDCNDSFWKKYFKVDDKSLVRLIYRILVIIMLWPIALFLFFMSERGLRGFLQAKLPQYLIKAVMTKTFAMYQKLGLEHRSVNDKIDFHRVIMHYVYLNIDNAQRKADNYVALYGFLRAICLILTLFYDVIAVNAVYTLRYLCNDKVEAEFSWFILILLISGFVVCNLLYLGFVKFYRRFTLENFMALITEKEIQEH